MQFYSIYFRFITFTGNPNWPEIQAELAPGQDYTTRPDLVCRVFIARLEIFLDDILKKHIMGKVKGWGYSVEHQKRGSIILLLY